MRSLVVAALCACGPGLAGTEQAYRSPKLQDFAAQLTSASQQQDVASVRALLRDSVTIGGLWFQDIECVKQFSAPGEVRGPRLDALARCLTALDLATSPRIDALPDVAVLTYGPGIELEARFVEGEDGPWLAWIGYVARRDPQDALPTISAAALESLRVAGDRSGGPYAPSAFPELAICPSAYAWLKVCIDGQGAVTGAHVREATSPRTARTFADAVRTWQFRPFMAGSQPTPVCAMVLMAYPGDKEPKVEKLPLPLPVLADDVTNVPSAMVKRVAGETLVAPDAREKTLLQKARIKRVVAAFHYCIDTTGRVSRVLPIRHSGLPRYDRKLVEAIQRWTYQPFVDEGRPVPVCSSVHYIYNQDAGRVHGLSRAR